MEGLWGWGGGIIYIQNNSWKAFGGWGGGGLYRFRTTVGRPLGGGGGGGGDYIDSEQQLEGLWGVGGLYRFRTTVGRPLGGGGGGIIYIQNNSWKAFGGWGDYIDSEQQLEGLWGVGWGGII